PVPETDPLEVADGVFLITDTLACFDHVRHRLKLVTHVRTQRPPIESRYAEAVARIDDLARRLNRTVRLKALEPADRPAASSLNGRMSEPEFFEAVEQAKAHILAGDIYQVQVAQRFTVALEGDPFDVYRLLRALNPSPYMYFLKLPAITIVGTSPEILVTVQGRNLRYRPIAGTRRRGRDDVADRRMEAELRSSEKERAEHVMLVDLGRNDLGRVCEIGSVADSVPAEEFLETRNKASALLQALAGAG